jgi:hypothetical protein
MSEHSCQRCGDLIPEGKLRIAHLGLGEYSKPSLRNVVVLDEKCYRGYFNMVNRWLEHLKKIEPDLG